MIVTFISNFLNHHQKPICDALFNRLGGDFKFVSTISTPKERIDMGYYDYTKVSYNLLAYSSKENMKLVNELVKISDVVLFGACDFEIVKERILDNKLTFRYTEHIFKKGEWQKFNLRALRFMFRFHTRYRNRNLHLLCSSAFVPNDMNWVWAYPDKMYRWGYMTNVEKIDIEKLVSKKFRTEKIKLLWVGRFVKYKHPEFMLELAQKLVKAKHNFEITMIGSGELYPVIASKVRKYGMSEYFFLKGSISNEDVLKEMKSSNFFIQTSNKGEGWGASINEAMSNGCVVIAGSEIGSVPYLIQPGYNGLVFKSMDTTSLANTLETAIKDLDYCKELSINAYNTMYKTWSPKTASKNLMDLFLGLLNDSPSSIEKGPCSRASVIPKNWYDIQTR